MTALAETVRSKDAYLLRVSSFYSCDIIFGIGWFCAGTLRWAAADFVLTGHVPGV